MPDLITPAINELLQVSLTVFNINPIVNKQYRSARAERIDWRRLVQAYQTNPEQTPNLVPPWTVFDIGRNMSTSDWAIDIATWRLPVTFYFCDDIDNSTLEVQEQKTQAFRDKLLPGAQYWNTFTIVDCSEMDSSPSNPANSVFFEANYPFLATALYFEILVSETIPGPLTQAWQ